MGQDKRVELATATTEEFMVSAFQIITKHEKLGLHPASHQGSRELIIALVDSMTRVYVAQLKGDKP